MRSGSFILFFFCCTLTIAFRDGIGQPLSDHEGNVVQPYYLNLNTASSSTIFEVRGDYLHLQYADAFGKEKTLSLVIQDWRGKTVSSLTLAKVFGLNNFDINFKERHVVVVFNQTYQCSVRDESGKTHALHFRYLPPLKRDIIASILVKPDFVECNNPEGSNLISYYGKISGGKAPYHVNWYVMNKTRTDFLYRPDPSKLLADGDTPSIEVDQSPEYYVLLYVQDSCGNEQTSTINMTCEENKRKINTIFFNKDDNLLKNNRGTH